MKNPSLNEVLFPIKSVCSVITFSTCILIITCCGCGKEEETEKAVEFKDIISAPAESQSQQIAEEAAPVVPEQPAKVKETTQSAQPVQQGQPVQPEVVKPITAQDLYNKGVECLNQGQLEDAVEAFNRATDMDSLMVDAYKKNAIACSKLGIMNEAIISFKKVVELNPNDAESYFSLGTFYAKRRLTDDAIWAFERYVSLNPNKIGRAHV